jgi:hypothetical protein
LWCELFDQDLELLSEVFDRPGQLPDAADHVSGDPDPDRLLGLRQAPHHLCLPGGVDQHA